MSHFYKFPRTRHLEGSQIQKGDEDLQVVPFSEVRGKTVILSEKVDGANVGVRFSSDFELQIQNRGHVLTFGGREKYFFRLEKWARNHLEELWTALSDRYILYGEWLYAKHTLFYDQLPHYFLEFDIFDVYEEIFLDTDFRRKILKDLPVVSIPQLYVGELSSIQALEQYMGKSQFISDRCEENLRDQCGRHSLDFKKCLGETDLSGVMEGLYLKIESNGKVAERLKFVQKNFLNKIEQTDHWSNRPIMPNCMTQGSPGFYEI